MKKNFILALLVILVAVASCSFTNKSFDNDDKDKFLLELISYVLEKGHYEPKEVNDSFSSNVFDDFIEVIDPTKRYFLQAFRPTKLPTNSSTTELKQCKTTTQYTSQIQVQI